MAGFNINGFKSNISESGVLHSNKFVVAFVSPKVMQNNTVDNQPVIHTERLIQARAEAVKIPGIALIMTDVARYGVGPQQKMPHNATFTPNSISFISDKNGELYKYFYTWLNKIFDFSGEGNIGASYTNSYKDDYTTDLHVYVYDQSGNQVKDIVMRRAFPESLNDVPLGWSNNGNLVKLTVTFSFRDWAMVGVSNVKNGDKTNPTQPTGLKLFNTNNPTLTSNTVNTIQPK